jgi:hypothetical protein
MSHVRPTSIGQIHRRGKSTPIGRRAKSVLLNAMKNVGTELWAERMAETFDKGLALAGERHGQAENDLRDTSARLTALEQRIK